jgi:group I intron endonuclease
MTGIYKITSPSNKVYIGQSLDIERRWKDHIHENRCKHKNKLYHSFKKYGVSNHKFEIVHELPSDVEQSVLDTYEQLYMDLHRNVGMELLNLREAGSKGRPSEESKMKMSLAKKGKPAWNKGLTGIYTEEQRNKISESLTGRKQSAEMIAKRVVKLKGRVFSDDHKRKISEANKGRRNSPESIAITAQKNKGRKVSDETKIKISAFFKGKPLTEEHKRKIGEANRKIA